MAKRSSPNFVHLVCFLAVMVMAYAVVTARARPLKAMEEGAGEWLGGDGDWIVGLVLDGIKSGGPSPGVGHHGFVDFNGMKDSGPSPGDGHGFNLNGGMKDSGPSPGDGHGFNLNGGMKDSGPSPGDGHGFNLNGGMKNSGPSPGDNH